LKKIIFVCTGNTCRSPMAEGILEHLIENNIELKNEFDCISTGLYAFNGDPVHPNAYSVLKTDYNIDISKHRAMVLNKSHLEEAFLVLTMTQKHKEMIFDIYPEFEKSDKIMTIKEFVEPDGDDLDIKDPFGQNVETYRKCASEIKSALDKVVTII